jgi:hypothetical protein
MLKSSDPQPIEEEEDEEEWLPELDNSDRPMD